MCKLLRTTAKLKPPPVAAMQQIIRLDYREIAIERGFYATVLRERDAVELLREAQAEAQGS